jgi:hypothetical protein
MTTNKTQNKSPISVLQNPKQRRKRDSLPLISQNEGLHNALAQGLKIKRFQSPVSNESVDIKDDL